MAWQKVPEEHFPLFHASLPKDKRVRTVNMFGAVVGLVNGNMFSGLFERSAIVRLSPADHEEAMQLDGAALFDPMGTGRGMARTVVLPESIMDEPAELRAWFRRAFEHVSTLPAKVKKPRAAPSPRPSRGTGPRARAKRSRAGSRS
jgi:TfoX/Sxy family transcriptional regulator of competence genes